jgi:hypothetical protein
MSIPNPAPQAPQQSQPQSNDEAISSLARGFLGEIDKDTPTDALNPNEPQQPQQPEAATDETPEPEAETPTQPEIPLVEIELDGEKFSVPEKLKGRFMADKDYRQKTMATAEQRKQLETLTATAERTIQQAQQMAPYIAQLNQMDSHAQHLDSRLRSQELAQDPVEFNRVQGELALLLRNRDLLAQGLTQQQHRIQQQQTALRAQQLAMDAPKLFEQFPDLQKPETQQKLTKYAVDEGLPQEVLDYLNFSAVGTKLLMKAFRHDLMVKDQEAAQAKLKETVKTLPSAAQSSRAAERGAKDKQLQKEWQKGGGKISDPSFDALLRSKLRG